jgi:bifunctional DNA-binding transcriptional regulator/antitoxin component of YhaV-PrlF toxin-antitoxin module
MRSMNAAVTAKVSHRGQTSLPAALRHRWSLEEGGEVAIIDLGGSALIVPGGASAARRELHRVLRARYEDAVAALPDPELTDS